MPRIKVFFISLFLALLFLSVAISRWGIPSDNYFSTGLKRDFSAAAQNTFFFTGAILAALLLLDFLEGFAPWMRSGRGAAVALLILTASIGTTLFIANTLRTPAGAPNAAPKCDGCNLLLISIEGFKATRSELYGRSPPEEITPFLSALSQKAFVFDRAFSAAPLQYPSGEVSILSSETLSTHHIFLFQENDTVFVPELPKPLSLRFFAAAKARGYRTGYFTEGLPAANAFSQSLLDNSSIDTIFLGETFSEFRKEILQLDGGEKFAFYLGISQQMETTFQAGNGEERNVGLLRIDRASGEFLPLPPDGLQITKRAGERAIEEQNLRYDEYLRSADRKISEVISLLGEQKLLERTVIVITAPRGDAAGETSREIFAREFGVRSFEETYAPFAIDASETSTSRVPLLIIVPGGRGARSSRAVSTLDILPTVFGITGLAIPPGTGGAEGTDLFSGAQQQERGSLMIETLCGAELLPDEGYLELSLRRSAIAGENGTYRISTACCAPSANCTLDEYTINYGASREIFTYPAHAEAVSAARLARGPWAETLKIPVLAARAS